MSIVGLFKIGIYSFNPICKSILSMILVFHFIKYVTIL
jgi:hypothetical protein